MITSAVATGKSRTPTESVDAICGGLDPLRLGFVRVENAGRSQMAYAFAQQEVEQRVLEDEIELVTGGTRPADHVHDEVVRTMHAAGIDLSGGRLGGPRLKKHGRAITSSRWGSSTDDVCPAGRAGENRDWNLDDPDGKSAAEVGRIRDEIERRVTSLFDEPESRR